MTPLSGGKRINSSSITTTNISQKLYHDYLYVSSIDNFFLCFPHNRNRTGCESKYKNNPTHQMRP